MKSRHFCWEFRRSTSFLLIVLAIQLLIQSSRAAIALRSVSLATLQSGSPTTARPFGLTAKDVMVAGVAVRPDTASITPPAGWSLIMRSDNPPSLALPTTGSSLAIYSKLAAASEPSTYLWNISSNTGVVVGIMAFSGVATNNSISAFDGQPTPFGFQHTAPSITPDVNKAMIISWHSYGSSNPWSPPPGMHELLNYYTANLPGTSGISLEGNFLQQTNAAATGPLTATVPNDAYIDAGNAITLALRPINNAPLLNPANSPTLGTVNEDPGPPSGRVGALVSSLVGFSTSSSQVDGVIDTDSGAQLGIAIIGTDTANGTGYYSLDGGTNWTEMGAVDITSARLLAADSDNRIYFQPGANLNGIFTNAFTFRAWDRSRGLDGDMADTTSSGGTTAFSTATDTISLKVNAVNDPPTADNLSADETFDNGVPLNLTPIVISDIDSTNVTATLKLSNPNAGSLSTATSGAVTSTYNAATGIWTASGLIDDVNTLLAQITFTSTADFYNNFVITTSVSDGIAPPLTGTKTMIFIGVNNTPNLLSPAIDSGQISFTITGTAGMLYCIEASTSLDSPDWISIETNTAPFQFQIPATNNQEFYRARLVQ